MSGEDEVCSCVLCGITSLTSVLYEINNNSVLIDASLIDLESLLFTLLNRTINTSVTSYICEDCKEQIVKFHIFKESATQNLRSNFFENAIQELRDFFTKNKEKEDFELECTENEFILRVKSDPFELKEEFEPIYEEAEINSQISEEFIEDTEETYFAEEQNEDSSMDIIHDTISESSVIIQKAEEDSEMRIIVDSLEEQEEKVYTCDCGACFSTMKQLQNHRSSKHSRKTTNTHTTQFICDSCNVSFKEERYSRIHEKAHESFDAIIPEMPTFHCTDCNFLFSNEIDLMTHIEMHEKKIENVDCHFIERISAFEDHFIRNDKSSVEDDEYMSDEGVFNCGHCGLKKTEHLIKLHLLFFHSTVIFCPFENRCFEGHKQVRQFPDHVRNKHPEVFNKKIEYICTCCNAKFSTPFEKLAHMKTCNMKKFVCEKHCGKRFKSEWLLKNHLKFIENGGDKRFSCNQCSKHCVSKSDLQIHMRSHTNERPYICSICSKAFKTSANRSSHMDTHRDDCIHECRVCKEKFKTRPILRKHMKKHDEVYKSKCICQICGSKAYINRTHLLRHIKSSHCQPDLTIEKIEEYFQNYLATKES